MDKILVGCGLHAAAAERLHEHAQVLSGTGSGDDFLRQIPEADGILVGGQQIGPAEMELSQRLRVIGRHGVGIDNVDLAAASRRSIPVVYTPDGPTESTAEHTLMLMLAVARRLPQFDRAVREDDFGIQRQFEFLGRELRGKALGVVGLGRIGQRVAEMCRAALDMEVAVYDPFRDPADVAACGGMCVDDLVELARRVDVLTVHVPLSQETRHLIDRDVIRAMRPGGILISIARGPVVDEQALTEALQDGHLYGAGLDVFDPEPPSPDNPLLRMENVVLTPHVGSFTDEGRRLMGLTVVDDILRVLCGERPHYPANPEVWEQVQCTLLARPALIVRQPGAAGEV